VQGHAREKGLDLLVLLVTAGVFAVDVSTQLGVAVWSLYTASVVLSVLGTRPRLPLCVGVGTSALMAIGYFLSKPAAEEVARLAPLNRAFMVVVLLLMGWLGSRFVKEEWIKKGKSALNQAFPGEMSSFELGEIVLTQLARYVDASVGSIWFDDGSGILVRTGAWASGHLPGADTLRRGEGIVGQVASEGRAIVARNVPDGYLDVRSGVGAAPPRSLVVAPVSSGGTVQGVVELGFFGRPPAALIDLLERSSEVVGAAVVSARFRQRQAELLEETRRQAEELAEQRNELRVANEELEEQSRALLATQERLESEHAELEETNARLEDRTERLIQTQGLIQQKAAELERASGYKSEFLANMSHELRTPLNSALILAKLLAENRSGNLTAEEVAYATNIYAAGNDLLTLINDILDLSKIESGKTELSIRPTSVPELFAALQARFGPLATQKDLSLSIQIAENCPGVIESDPTRLQQILNNLLSNAIKFTEAGSVRLEARRSGASRIEFVVEDSGIGISSDQHQVIFEAFRQADGTTNRRFGGTGLGLSISRELASLLGGDIRLESAPQEGSRFIVTLPIRSAATSSSSGTLGPATSPIVLARVPRKARSGVDDDRAEIDSTSRTVLAIEDDPIFAGILRDLAHEMGFRCLLAGDGEEGLALAREYAPLAILLDIGLPDQSGLTVLELLKRSPETRHIPIHVVSVHDYQRVALEMGAIGYALKPVKREELEGAFRKLEAHLQRSARSVLVVEDDPVQRDAIARLLGGSGVEITPVGTAQEAFEKLRSATFDCMVLDLMLPGTSGFDLLSRMGDDGAAFPPVIVYTARALGPDEELRLRQHAKSIIVKGARSPERLLEEVTLFLHQVEADLPPEKRRMLRVARSREAIFEGRTILVVEDDVRNVYALTSALEPKGANIRIARNGREAIERLREGPPVDLVLMDVMMPEMDGLEATKAIRAIPAFSDLPIIALTAKAMPDDRQECLAAGASDYLAKPIDVDKLLSMVRVWMPR